MKRIVLILLALALLLSAARNASAASNQKRNDEHQHQTAKQAEKPQDQQVVLVPSPAYQAAILEALRSIVREEVSRQEQEHADYKRWNTPAFWFGTIGLLVVGACYTFFAGWQLVVIRRQGKTANDTLIETRKAANAAKDSADSYRAQLALQARPLLRVRQAYLQTERPYIKAGYVLVNVGGSTAHVISLTHGLTMGTAPPQLFSKETFDLIPGQKYVATVQAGGSLLRDQALPTLKLSGLVIYRDDAKNVRETSFDRLYQPLLHIFARVENWDSEYED